MICVIFLLRQKYFVAIFLLGSLLTTALPTNPY